MKTDLHAILATIKAKLQPIWRYRLVAFVIFVAALGGYLILEINQAVSVAPKSDASAAVSHTPRIDSKVVKQLQQLQDNSVSVQALFNQGRENPFE